ncbi:MAG TPA: head GIN domain-containing protein [Flavobacteriaceae bacterium]|nr:head GIN domain-containing protein [Flavobacteriaceae bacterium]
MKNKILIALLFLSAIAFAQEPITKNLGDFNTLKIFNGLSVELEKSNKAKLVITGSQADEVVVKNANGTLKIRLHFPENFIAEDVQVKLFYKNDIAILDANEGGLIFSEETIKQKHLEVKAQEGASIKLPVKTEHLKVKSVTGGVIILEGKALNQLVEVTTGGIYKGENVKSAQAVVTSASGGIVNVNVSDILDAKVRFGGNIYYKGKPKTIKEKKIIGGSIKPMY